MKKFLLSLLLVILLIFLAVGGLTLYSWTSATNYRERGIPILNYHQVNDVMYSPLTMQVSHFDEQMAHLAKNGYHSITMTELNNYLTEGLPLPEKPVLITFDDGYEDNYLYAAPVLKKYHMKATIFMIGNAIGEDRFMSATQLQELQKDGFDIEAHTYSHKPLTTFSDEEVIADLQKSRSVLEALLQKEVRYLAYPQGFYDERIMKLTDAAGFKLAFTVKAGMATPTENRLALPRLAVFEGDNPYLCLILRLHFPEAIAYLWHLRDSLKDGGYDNLAELVPLI